MKLKFLPILALLLVAGFTRADVLRAASPDSWPLPPPGPSYGAIGNCAEYIYCQTADFSVYGTGYVNDWLYQGPELWEMNFSAYADAGPYVADIPIAYLGIRSNPQEYAWFVVPNGTTWGYIGGTPYYCYALPGENGPGDFPACNVSDNWIVDDPGAYMLQTWIGFTCDNCLFAGFSQGQWMTWYSGAE